MRVLSFIFSIAVGALGIIAAPAQSTRIPRDVFALRPLDWIPTVPQVRVVPVSFPDNKPMGYVHALASTGERLWISAHPFGDTKGLCTRTTRSSAAERGEGRCFSCNSS